MGRARTPRTNTRTDPSRSAAVRRLGGALALLSLAACGSIPDAGVVYEEQEIDGATTYDQVQWIASHNGFEKARSPYWEVTLEHTSAPEIDFWDTASIGFGRRLAGRWYVRHAWWYGNENNGGDADLEEMLKQLHSWARRRAPRGVITVFLDKKQGWSEDRRPADLDALLLRVFEEEEILRPAEVQGDAASLRAACEAGAWPRLAGLRGRFVFVLTGGGLVFGRNATLAEYVAERGACAVAFVAPDTERLEDVTGVPEGFDAETAGAVVFHNVDWGDRGLVPHVRKAGHVSRLWDVPERREGEPDRVLLERLGANFVALNDFANVAEPRALRARGTCQAPPEEEPVPCSDPPEPLLAESCGVEER